MRLRAYAGVSACMAAGTLVKAFNERPNFYCATVYLSESNACILILTNFALVCVASFVFGLQRLLYGSLRQLEIEQLSEKAWYAVLDTLLAMPSLRDDVGGWTLATFVLLLAGKVWSWIGEGRVEILEQQPPPNPRMFHLRLATSLCISVLFDLGMFWYCLRTVLDNPGPGLIIIFTFEFAILSIFSISTACRYMLTLNEMRITQQQVKVRIAERKEEIFQERVADAQRQNDQAQPTIQIDDIVVDEDDIEVPGWEEKRQWLLVLDLATDAIKIIIYVAFFGISINFVGFPMHVMRDVYLTIASFSKRMTDYQVYKRTTADMNNRYPDATAQELANDNTCIVCREIMTPWQDGSTNASPASAAPSANTDTPQAQQASAATSRASAHRRTMTEWLRAKKLPCGHILHLRCLKAWLERQQACPTCRRPVAPTGDTVETARNDGAAAARPGENDANGARPARRNNVRWINMGPVRIGFGDRQPRRQADAAAAAPTQAAQAQAVGQAHSNFLSNSSMRLSHRSELTWQEQLRTLELRLLRQINALRLDHAQLLRVRLLEIELEQLRALQNANSSIGLLNPAAPRPHTPNPLDRGPSSLGTQHFASAFRSGSSQAVLGAGSSDLPEGVTLPPGWTLLPLARLSGQPPQGPAPASFAATPEMNVGVHPFGGRTPPVPRTGTPRDGDPASRPASTAPARAMDDRTTNTLPTLGLNGQPLDGSNHRSLASLQSQLAALEARSTASALSNGSIPSDSSDHAGASAVPAPQPVQAHAANPPESSGWNFGSLNSTRDASSSQNEAGNGTASTTKGKGRAVAVEDVPDDER